MRRTVLCGLIFSNKRPATISFSSASCNGGSGALSDRHHSGACLALFVHGDGGNGKGVTMNTVFSIMGDYAANAAMDAFVVTRGDKHTTDLAMLAGARMVMTTEVEEGQTWAEARIKALTGGDPITARFMYVRTTSPSCHSSS